MNRKIFLFLIFGLMLFGLGLGLTFINKNRAAQDRIYSLNTLRELSYYCIGNSGKGPETPVGALAPLERSSIPPASIVRPNIEVKDRLSWLVDALPYLNQKRFNTSELSGQFDLTKPSSWEANVKAGATPLPQLIPTTVREPVLTNGLASTYYTGIGGLGMNAMDLSLTDPEAWRIGSFRNNGDMPFGMFKDGLSTTLLMTETSKMVGPWAKAGLSTGRYVDDNHAPFASNGHFGGLYPGEACFSFADGSARFMHTNMDSRVLRALATAAGGIKDPSLTD